MSDLDDEQQGGRRPRRRRRRFGLVVVLVVLAGLVVWGVFAGSLLLRGRDRAESGRDALEALSGLDPLAADLEQVQRDIRSASQDLSAARRDLTSPVLAPLRPLPVIGRQLASARALATTADEVVAAVAPVVDRVIDGRAAGSEAGRRLVLLADLDQDLTAAQAVLRDADLGPDEALLAPLADARNDASAELAEVARDVDDALTVVRGLRGFLDGSSYVLLAANPAEMANGGGMYLSVGEMQTAAGDFELSELVRADDLFPVPGGAEQDPDMVARWGHISPGNDFRKLNLTPRFAGYSGPRALDLWQAVTGQRPAGAVVVDPVVIQALLEVIGPVDHEGTSYDADSMLQYALVGQYAEFGQSDEQGERRELVAGISKAAMEAMGERSWDPLDLIQALRPAAEGRRLLAYSEDPEQQAMWSLIGVSGELSGDELLVNLAATAGHKIDPFMQLAITATVLDDGGQRRLRLDVAIENGTPDAVSEFAAGSVRALADAEPGTYVGRLAVFAPSAATSVRFDPERTFEAYGRDGPLLLAATRLEVAPGDVQRLVFDVALADGVEQITVLPSGRVPAIAWRWGDEAWDDDEPRTIELG